MGRRQFDLIEFNATKSYFHFNFTLEFSTKESPSPVGRQ